VSKDGKALTNAHVVEQCSQVRVVSLGQESRARILARDGINDLALLATDIKPLQSASWRQAVRQGEDIVAYGYPLPGLLAAAGNVAIGNVTALAGPGDDSRLLQISAPLQPGNSGGPLFDRSGNVVGVVVATLSTPGMIAATGNIPQNLNFAIKASVAASFLDAQRVAHSEGPIRAALSTPDIAEQAKSLTVQVVCYGSARPAIAQSSAPPPNLAQDELLRNAALVHNVEGVRDALKNGANPNAPSTTARPMTPLTDAVMGRWRRTRNRTDDLTHNQAAAKLFQNGLGDEEIDKYLAIEIAKLLFTAGGRLGRYDDEILYFPIADGNTELVRILVDMGASLTNRIEGKTPTEIAKQYEQEAVYKLLVSRGGIPVDPRSSAQLAFVNAASYRDVQGMERALASGARINEAANKETALVAAVRLQTYQRREAEAIWWLLDHGADPNRMDGLGNLPLHRFIPASKYAIERPSSKPLAEETLTRLFKAGAKVSGVDSMGQTPLHAAAKYDNLWAAEALIQEGAKVMAKDTAGKTPLDYAESGPMIKLLKQNGATER
jgi:ankyrin repeat protein